LRLDISNQTTSGAFQGLSSGLHNALAGATGGPLGNPAAAAGLPSGWPYGALQVFCKSSLFFFFIFSYFKSPLYRFPTLSQYDWSKALGGAQGKYNVRLLCYIKLNFSTQSGEWWAPCDSICSSYSDWWPRVINWTWLRA